MYNFIIYTFSHIGGKLCNNMYFICCWCNSITAMLEYRFLLLEQAVTRVCPSCQNNAIWVNIQVCGLKTF